MPVRSAKSTPARCGAPPTPEIAKLSFPGFAFASATSSFTEPAGIDGCTTRMCGEYATIVTGAKSFAGSNGSFG